MEWKRKPGAAEEMREPSPSLSRFLFLDEDFKDLDSPCILSLVRVKKADL